MSDIHYIKHNEIDFEKWDRAVMSSQYPLVFAQPFYLNATHPGWSALMYDDYAAVFPLTAKTKFGIRYLHQPPFTPQLGAYGQINPEIEKQFSDYIFQNYKLIEIELNASNTLQTEISSTKTTYVIDYRNGYKFNQNTKRNCSKALENGLLVEEIHGDEAYKLSREFLNPFLISELQLSTYDISVFERLLLASSSVKALTSFRVLDANHQIRALAHFISNGKHAVYLKGTSFDRSENSGSMHLLMSEAIRYFETRSFLFDFGGGSKESLATFYKGFGGIPLNYQMLNLNLLPSVLKLFKR